MKLFSYCGKWKPALELQKKTALQINISFGKCLSGKLPGKRAPKNSHVRKTNPG